MKLSNESYFSLNFIARKRANKEGELPITLRITMNGQRAEIYVNRTVRPDDWNAAKGQSKGKTKKDLELNRYLDTVRTKICEIHNRLVLRDEPITRMCLNARSRKARKAQDALRGFPGG